MRMRLLGLALLALSGPAWAEPPARVDIARLCAEGPERQARLETTPAADAELDCAVAPDGAPISCTVARASPDSPTVRAIALSRLCYGARAEEGAVYLRDDGERAARFGFAFAVECTRARGAQVCAASRVRRQQLNARAPLSDGGG